MVSRAYVDKAMSKAAMYIWSKHFKEDDPWKEIPAVACNETTARVLPGKA
jgi:hypothetical protein